MTLNFILLENLGKLNIGLPSPLADDLSKEQLPNSTSEMYQFFSKFAIVGDPIPSLSGSDLFEILQLLQHLGLSNWNGKTI